MTGCTARSLSETRVDGQSALGSSVQIRERLKPFLVLALGGFFWFTQGHVWAECNDALKEEESHPTDSQTGLARPDLEVIARVNGDTISRAEFERMVANPVTLLQAQRHLRVEEPHRHDLERLAMRKLVQLRLLIQEATRRQITVTQDELDQAITELRRRFEDLNAFGVWVKAQGLNDPELFATVRVDMLLERVTTALAAEVSVTEAEAQEYFDKHREDLVIGFEVRLRIIAVNNEAEADQIFSAIQKGAPFNQLARQRSIGRLAAKGGDTGWVRFRSLSPLLQQAVLQLKPGEVSGPFEKSKDEFLIVGLQDRRPICLGTLNEAAVEIRRRLLPGKQQKFIETWLKQQEATAKIEVADRGE